MLETCACCFFPVRGGPIVTQRDNLYAVANTPVESDSVFNLMVYYVIFSPAGFVVCAPSSPARFLHSSVPCFEPSALT